MKISPVFSVLHELAALIGRTNAAPDAERLLEALERELWTAFSIPLARGDLAAVGYALARLCTVSDRLTANGRSLPASVRSAANALLALVDRLPTLHMPGELPDSAAFRRSIREPLPTREREFLTCAQDAWEACIRAALGGL